MTELIEAAADGNPELLREAVWKEYEELKGRIEVRQGCFGSRVLA